LKKQPMRVEFLLRMLVLLLLVPLDTARRPAGQPPDISGGIGIGGVF
jgi:hypothetical protein